MANTPQSEVVTGGSGSKVNIELVARDCMMRILDWAYRPGSQPVDMVRDWNFLITANTQWVTAEDISDALKLLESRGYITITYPEPDSDPEGFIIRLAPRKD